MRIAVLGAGAIGCLIGLRLHESDQTVLLIHHDTQTVNSIRKRGVNLTELSGKTIRARIEVSLLLPRDYDPDFILLTVKAYDTQNAVRHLPRKMRGKTPILSLQNGLGNTEILSRYFPKDSILAGATTEGALGTGPGTVTHTGRGLTWIGEFHGKRTNRSIMIRDAFRHAGFRTIASSNIESVIWSKAIVNSAINPVSALARVSNGELRRSSSLMDLAMRLVKEGVMVAKANRVSPAPTPRSMLFETLRQARKNRSSMLRDIEAGRKTEIRQLNGFIASLGRRLGIDVPYNALIWKLVQGLEDSRAQLSP